MITVAPVTLVAELLRNPAQISSLRIDAIPDLIAELSRLQSLLLLRITTGKNETPVASRVEKDLLLTAAEAAPLLGVSVRWLYRHWKNLPFSRRLSRKTLRFSEDGVRRY